jgi:hypothetical protein
MALFPLLPISIARKSKLVRQFDDSTHGLWSLEALDGSWLFLKVVEEVDTPFWRVMKALFALDLNAQLDQYALVYRQIAALTPLHLPTLLASDSASAPYPAYLLTDFMQGESLCVADVNADHIQTLASHLASLHRANQPTWGNLLLADRDAHDWCQLVNRVLMRVFPDDVLRLSADDVQAFVPMMPDLRWDQFLVQDGKVTALVDLDAFVIAPIELDFVLLEYLMTAEQLAVWQKAYCECGGYVPHISHQVRVVYRKLLFAMQVLGEIDVKAWLNHPAYFV